MHGMGPVVVGACLLVGACGARKAPVKRPSAAARQSRPGRVAGQEFKVSPASVVREEGGEPHRGAALIDLWKMKAVRDIPPDGLRAYPAPALFVEPSGPEIGILNGKVAGFERPDKISPKSRIRAGLVFTVTAEDGSVFVVEIVSYEPGSRESAEMVLRIRRK